MNDHATDTVLPRALLVLRITLGIFLLQWGVEKFVVPASAEGIWQYFYGMTLPRLAAYIAGAVEIALALCLFLGLFRTMAYAAATLLHAITVLVTWRQLLDPWGDPVNHLFIAAVPVLGAFVALFLLRKWDTLSVARG
jgi:putative oxidoreductase